MIAEYYYLKPVFSRGEGVFFFSFCFMQGGEAIFETRFIVQTIKQFAIFYKKFGSVIVL